MMAVQSIFSAGDIGPPYAAVRMKKSRDEAMTHIDVVPIYNTEVLTYDVLPPCFTVSRQEVRILILILDPGRLEHHPNLSS